MVERVLPRDFPDPPEFLIPLSNAELQELGTFTAIWSQIDWIMFMMIGQLAKVEYKTLNMMMEGMTTGPRVKLLKRLCQENPSDAAKGVTKLCNDNGGLIEDRNHIIHGLWAVDWNYATGETKAGCLFQKGKRLPISAQKLQELSNRAARFSNGLGNYMAKITPVVGIGEKPRLFLFGAGGHGGHPPPPWPPKQP
jgi:hypothetical protein